MLYALAAWLLAAVSWGVGAARYRRVSSDDGAAALAAALRGAGGRAARALVEREPRTRATALLREVLDAKSHAHAVAAINEHLADVAWELEGAGVLPRAAARVALAGATGAAVARIATGLGTDGPWLGWAAAAFGGGLVAAMGSLGLARRAERVARERRDAWNRVASALGRLGAESPERAS
ncbi:MAG: hypothetical protein OZ921_03630 [Sorangiineae bacterium]|nr:hypothetical protein [Polyangiaceae bacterium]MEB2321580.1 hypothetical protein [Sorangiineae bacterium]